MFLTGGCTCLTPFAALFGTLIEMDELEERSSNFSVVNRRIWGKPGFTETKKSDEKCVFFAFYLDEPSWRSEKGATVSHQQHSETERSETEGMLLQSVLEPFFELLMPQRPPALVAKAYKCAYVAFEGSPFLQLIFCKWLKSVQVQVEPAVAIETHSAEEDIPPANPTLAQATTYDPFETSSHEFTTIPL